MKNFKKEQGITLIALIITVIILVILAAVSIRAVTNMKIVDYAINGAQNYVIAGKEENKVFGDVENLIGDALYKINKKEEAYNKIKKAVDRIKARGEEVLIKNLKEELDVEFGEFGKDYLIRKDDLGIDDWKVVIPDGEKVLYGRLRMPDTEKEITYIVGKNGIKEVDRNEEGVWINGVHVIHRLMTKAEFLEYHENGSESEFQAAEKERSSRHQELYEQTGGDIRIGNDYYGLIVETSGPNSCDVALKDCFYITSNSTEGEIIDIYNNSDFQTVFTWSDDGNGNITNLRWGEIIINPEWISATMFDRRVMSYNYYMDAIICNLRGLVCFYDLNSASEDDLEVTNNEREYFGLSTTIQEEINKLPERDRGIRVVANGKEYRGIEGFKQFLIETYDIENEAPRIAKIQNGQ